MKAIDDEYDGVISLKKKNNEIVKDKLKKDYEEFCKRYSVYEFDNMIYVTPKV